MNQYMNLNNRFYYGFQKKNIYFHWLTLPHFSMLWRVQSMFEVLFASHLYVDNSACPLCNNISSSSFVCNTWVLFAQDAFRGKEKEMKLMLVHLLKRLANVYLFAWLPPPAVVTPYLLIRRLLWFVGPRSELAAMS